MLGVHEGSANAGAGAAEANAAALFLLRKKLVSRPKWQETYGPLSDVASDAVSVEYALQQWLAVEFAGLVPAEIERAARRLVVDSAFAPDLRAIRQTCLDSAVQARYGDSRHLFPVLIKKIVYWMHGGAVEWRPVEAYLVLELGARRLTESAYHDIRKEWTETLYKFIVEKEPNVVSHSFFARLKKNDINILSANERKRFSVLQVRAILKREACCG